MSRNVLERNDSDHSSGVGMDALSHQVESLCLNRTGANDRDGGTDVAGSNDEDTAADETSNKPPVDTLPPEVWARILEYTVFSDIAHMTREFPFTLFQAVPLMRFLYLDKDVDFEELSNNHDFDRVEEIILDCVIRNVGIGVYFEVKDCNEGNGELMSFLCSLKNLKRVLVGAGESETKKQIVKRIGRSESNRHVVSDSLRIRTYWPQDSTSSLHYSHFLSSLSAAYSTGRISQEVFFHGLPSHHLFRRAFVEDECETCQSICQNFPLEQLLSLKSGTSRVKNMYFPHESHSVTLGKRFEWISRRQGGKEALICRQERLFGELLGMHYGYSEECKWHGRLLYGDEVLDAMAQLKASGCDPGLIRVRDVIPDCVGLEIRRIDYTKLIEIGFQVSEDDFDSVVSMFGVQSR